MRKIYFLFLSIFFVLLGISSCASRNMVSSERYGAPEVYGDIGKLDGLTDSTSNVINNLESTSSDIKFSGDGLAITSSDIADELQSTIRIPDNIKELVQRIRERNPIDYSEERFSTN